jgi:prepilin-type N-terminal cleavage/methylation domain-containing protein
MYMTKHKNGFSLLELLVVISIIGILVAISAVAFTTAQKRGRDARRRGDLKAWQDALEQTYSEYTDYQGAGTSGACEDAVTDHMNGVTPSDPKGGSYAYAPVCTADTYCLCALLEQGSGGNSDSDDCTAFDDSGDEEYYCLENLQ